jgi:hypothetical protein
MRDLDQREAQARARLAELKLPLDPPAELVAAQDLLARVAERKSLLADGRREADQRFEALIKAQPMGFWAWINGSMRAHEKRVAEAQQACGRHAEAILFASTLHDGAEARVHHEEDSWREKARRLEMARTEERQRVETRLAWIAAARLCITRDPDLAHAPPAHLIEAVRQAHRHTEAETDVLVFSKPGPRPR